ncbi:MAG: flagellar motor switch protein FliN [Candidatus Delongbacteria bacterium]|nr:flagellar motor switch protein FliN [Candidatus Delongbacteria bacterium]
MDELNQNFSNQALSKMEQAIIKDLESGFAASSAGILQTIINRDVAMELVTTRLLDEGLLMEMADEMVGLTWECRTGPPGSVTMLLERELTARVVDLMIMGDGNVEFMPEEHLDGIVEALGQMQDNWQKELSSRADSQVEFSPGKPELLSRAEIAQNLEGQVVVSFRMAIKGLPEYIFFKLYPRETLQWFTKTLSTSVSVEEEVEPPAPPAAEEPETTTAEVHKAEFPEFTEPPAKAEETAPPLSGEESAPTGLDQISIIMDLELPIAIELGRTRMLIRDLVRLGAGSIIELNKLSGEPVDLYVNEKKFARGEVVVIDENFGVRITEILKVEERLQHLAEA